MKINLSCEEIYPVYREATWTSANKTEVEVPEELWREYEKTRLRFFELLDDLEGTVLSQHRNGI